MSLRVSLAVVVLVLPALGLSACRVLNVHRPVTPPTAETAKPDATPSPTPTPAPGTTPGTTPGPVAVTSLEPMLGDWEVTALDGMPLGDDVKDQPPTLTVSAEGRVSGFAGVNRYFTGIDRDALGRGALKLSPAGRTMMAGPDERMRLEDTFMDRLGKADAATIHGSILTLTGDGEVLVTLKKR